MASTFGVLRPMIRKGGDRVSTRSSHATYSVRGHTTSYGVYDSFATSISWRTSYHRPWPAASVACGGHAQGPSRLIEPVLSWWHHAEKTCTRIHLGNVVSTKYAAQNALSPTAKYAKSRST